MCRTAVAATERQHDDAEREHRQSHEFEYQRVTRQFPQQTVDLREAIDVINFGLARAPAMWTTVNGSRPAERLQHPLMRLGGRHSANAG